MKPLLEKEDNGELEAQEEQEIDKLQGRIDYFELFCQKFSVFKTEMDGKVDYAKREFETLKEKSDKIIKQFGCNPEQVKPKDLFQTFFDFA